MENQKSREKPKEKTTSLGEWETFLLKSYVHWMTLLLRGKCGGGSGGQWKSWPDVARKTLKVQRRRKLIYFFTFRSTWLPRLLEVGMRLFKLESKKNPLPANAFSVVSFRKNATPKEIWLTFNSFKSKACTTKYSLFLPVQPGNDSDSGR